MQQTLPKPIFHKSLAKKAVLFDLDGTLIDTAPDFIRIIKQLCQKHQRICPADAVIRAQVSAGSKAMAGLLCDESLDDDARLMAYRQELLNAYEQEICIDSRLFEGLDELLKHLENNQIAWGIVTNKPRHLSELLLAKLSLSHRCAVLVCPQDVMHTKPNPEPMWLAVNRLQHAGVPVEVRDCLYVGDHERDIEAGRQAGMTTVAASYGYVSADDQPSEWGADFVVDTPNELVRLILEWIK